MCACALYQIEVLSPVHGRPTVVHPELVVNVFGVRPHGIEGHHESAGNVRAVQVSSEQPQHVALAFAQHLLDRLT